MKGFLYNNKLHEGNNLRYNNKRQNQEEIKENVIQIPKIIAYSL